tara:strand:+ start:115996 stop:116439 length:444 start_codon:yes stop_codon:yes gene_type:complete
MSTKKINDFFKNNKLDSFLFFENKNNKLITNNNEQEIENLIVEFSFTILKVKSFTKDTLKISVTEKDYTKMKNNKDKNIIIHYENSDYKKQITYTDINFLEKDQENKNKYIFELKINSIVDVIEDIIENIYEDQKILEFLKIEKNEI